jgi:transposase
MLQIRSAIVHRVRVLGAPLAQACREYGMSRKTAYKWLKRFDAEPDKPLADHSRRPRHSPKATKPEVIQFVLAACDATGSGARILAKALVDAGHPARSVATIRRILAQNGRISPPSSHTTGWTYEPPEAIDPVAWHAWLSKVLADARSVGRKADPLLTARDLQDLWKLVATGQRREAKRAAAVILLSHGLRRNAVQTMLKSSRGTVLRYWNEYKAKGISSFPTYDPAILRKVNHKETRDAIFALLHSPPAAYGINRSTWRMADLNRVLRGKGKPTSLDMIRVVIKRAGYRWKHARVVLTSQDPAYRAKLDHIHSILSALQPDEAFFSIDEYGPFAIKLRAGRLLVPPGETPTVPQYQKSKGSLLVAAAIELSSNQVTHLYPQSKNTNAMLELMQALIDRYCSRRKLYFSWDAASWHGSKKLCHWVDQVNNPEYRSVHGTPLVELAPLPAGAQFLNVIESVFSGLARAIIHNSNFQSVTEAMAAIDRHFRERNEHFENHPQRAGRKIWGKERVGCEFDESQNCKEPKWR